MPHKHRPFLPNKETPANLTVTYFALCFSNTENDKRTRRCQKCKQNENRLILLSLLRLPHLSLYFIQPHSHIVQYTTLLSVIQK